MKLSARKDIDAPVADVYDICTDIAAWERTAMRRGVDIRRKDTLSAFGPGLHWAIGFLWREKTRAAEVKLVSAERPTSMTFHAFGSLMDVMIEAEFVALSVRKSRIILRTEIKPRNLSARVIVQSLKLARGRIEAKYDARLGQLVQDLEQRLAARRKV
jgi:hypothetical protein